MRAVILLLVLFIIPFPFAGAQSSQKLNLKDDLGDFAFFDSNYIMHRSTGVFNSDFPEVISTVYPNFTAVPRENTIECERLNHYNIDKGDRIIMRKTTGENLYFDIKTSIYSNYDSSKVYKYFKISTDVMFDMQGEANSWLFLLRDSTGSENLDIMTSTVSSNGNIAFYGKKNLSGYTKKWFSYEVYVDLEGRFLKSYIDGQFVDEGTLPESFNHLSMIRAIYRNNADGFGEIQFRNLKVIGLDKPMINDMEIKTTMFYDDSVIEDYLSDKAGFQFYGQTFYANGKKYKMCVPPVLNDGELYISGDDFNTAFSTDINSETLIPLGEYVKKYLAGEVFCDLNTGTWIISPQKLPYNPEDEIPYHKRKVNTGKIDRLSDIQHISDFLFFDRPNSQTLLQSFNQYTNFGEQHPRVLANADDFMNIREQRKTDSHLNSMVNNLIKQADEVVSGKTVEYKFDDELRLHAQSKLLKKYMYLLGFAYQMTGEQKYADTAWRNFEVLAKFPDINPGHPIDAGTFCFAMGIGYDWLYHGYTPDQREAIFNTSKRLALTVLNDAFYGRTTARGGPNNNINVTGLYTKWISNYNTFMNGGTIIASLAMAENEPALCFDLLKNSIRSMEYTSKGFWPEGAWIESNGYWEVAVENMALSSYAMIKSLGSDYQFLKTPGFDNTCNFMLGLQSPNGSYIYHDATNNKMLAHGIFGFFDKYYNKPELSAALKMRQTGHFQSVGAGSTSVLDILFYTPDVNISAIYNMPNALAVKGLESFSVHQDYTDENGLFFASHGGPVSFYHAHNDVGDFVFDMLGEKWAETLDSENYNLSGSESTKYRNRTEGHNTLTINNDSNLNQKSGVFSEITDYMDNSAGAYAVYDMSQLYNAADKLLRGFYIDKDYKKIIVRDEINLTDEAIVYWFMHTKADIKVTGRKSAVLTQNNKSIFLNFETDAEDFEVFPMEAEQMDGSVIVDGQRDNGNVKKVAIRLSGSGAVNLTVQFSDTNILPDATPISEWEQKSQSNTHIFSDNFNEFNSSGYSWVNVTPDKDFDSKYITLKNGSLWSGLDLGNEFTLDFDFKNNNGDLRLLFNQEDEGIFLTSLKKNLWYHAKVYVNGGNIALYIDGSLTAAALVSEVKGIGFLGSGSIDNINLTSGEYLPSSVKLLEQDFSGFELNNSKSIKQQKLSSSLVRADLVGDAVRYDNIEGVFGKEITDTSFYIHNTSDYHDNFTDAYFEISGAEPVENAVQELSFQAAFDTLMTPVAVNAYAWAKYNNKYVSAKCLTNDSSGFFRLYSDKVMIWNKVIPLSFGCISEKWYNIRIVTTGGEVNRFSAYIDDKVICENMEIENFSLRLNGTDYENGGEFFGLSQVWLNHNFKNYKESENIYEARGMYFDDIKLINHLNGSQPKREETLGETVLYAASNDCIEDITERKTFNNAVYRKNGLLVDSFEFAGGAYIDIEKSDGSHRYGAIKSENHIYLEKRDFIVPDGWLKLGNFSSTGRAIRDLVWGLGGKAADDISTAFSPPFQQDTNSDYYTDYIYYTFNDNKVDNEPVTVSINLLSDDGAELELQLRTHTLENTSGAYNALISLCDGVITASGYKGQYEAGKWTNVSATVYPITNRAEIRVNGNLISTCTISGTAIKYFSTARVKILSQSQDSGFAAIDDWLIYSGCYNENISADNAFDGIAVWSNGVRLRDNLADEGELRIKAKKVPNKDGITLAALYDNNTLLSILNINESNETDFTFFMTRGTHIKLIGLTSLEDLTPLGLPAILSMN